MTIDELITVAESRLLTLANWRETAVRHGDMATIADVDREVMETSDTLSKLKTLLT